MKIQYCSDLHLEFPENEMYLRRNPIEPKADILVLAGDIVPFNVMDRYNWFFEYISANFKHTYWVPGNHEYYYSDILQRRDEVVENIRDNITLVNNTTVQHENTTFVFSTLWSAISNVNQVYIQHNLSDFVVIRKHHSSFEPGDYNRMHRRSIAFVKEACSKDDGTKKVVVTHHVPTFMHYPQKYKGSSLNEAFATEFFDYIEQSGISCWIYGHHHFNANEFTIGKTQMRTNQLGYIAMEESSGYQNGRIIEI